jgi:DNA-binding response OmpR family regulator
MKDSTILLVEDENEIRVLLSQYLRNEGYRVQTAADGVEALERLQREFPDLILLDVMLPDIDGFTICRNIRERSDAPIFFVSARRDAEDIIQGLDTGADDYIVKPFDPKVIVARVNAFFRRKKAGSIYIWKDERLVIERDSLDVRVNGEMVMLSAKERQLLLFLAKHPMKVFSVRQLFEEIWGWDRASDERTVMVHIRYLRRKIEQNPANPKYIVTVKGFGYRFEKGG